MLDRIVRDAREAGALLATPGAAVNTPVVEELQRLNDNIEALIVNGLDVRMHEDLCIKDSRVRTKSDAQRVRIFVGQAIDRGALKLDTPPAPEDPNA
jgi:hypothetical protein